METVLFATDSSPYADLATDEAIELAAEHDATLHVLCVVDSKKFDEPALSTHELATITVEDRFRECLEAVSRRAADAGVAVVREHRHGRPADEILAYADEVDADVVVVGEHGDHEAHFGGVGRAVRKRGDREVLVVAAAGT